MNRENITKVRDVIAALPAARFDMRFLSNWTTDKRPLGSPANHDIAHSCNTAACIAGWTNAVFGHAHETMDGSEEAGRHLDLTEFQTARLFCPPGFLTGRYTQAQAIRVLDILLETRRVNWGRAIREVPAP